MAGRCIPHTDVLRPQLSEICTKYSPRFARAIILYKLFQSSVSGRVTLSLVKLSLQVLFLVASLDSFLRDTTHWLLANTHSSLYDNPFDPSCRHSTPSHPSLSLQTSIHCYRTIQCPSHAYNKIKKVDESKLQELRS